MLKKRTKKVNQISVQRRKTPIRKKVNSKSRKIVQRKNAFSSASIYSSFIIFIGFISLSFTIFFLARQLQPLIKNEKLKYLCTYQLGDRKSQSYKDSKLELEKLVGNSEKYCKNFLLPNEKNKRRLFPTIRNILFRFI